MFSLWKKLGSTRSFRRLAPDGLVDLHSHVLPAVDDGAGSVEDSRALIGILERLGYVSVAATPHFDPATGEPSVKKQRDLIDQLERAGATSNVQLSTGAEILFDARFVEEVSEGHYPSLGRGNWYLVEFGFTSGSVPLRMEDAVFKLRAQGVGMVLAHPERCPDLRESLDRLEQLRQAGMLVQIGAASLGGKHGDAVREAALRIVDAGLLDLVASDIHRAKDEPYLSSGLKILSQLAGKQFARLVSETPRSLLEDTDLSLLTRAPSATSK